MAGLSEERRQRIIELFAEGRSKAEISRIVGCSRPTVYNILASVGEHEFADAGEEFTEDEEEVYTEGEAPPMRAAVGLAAAGAAAVGAFFFLTPSGNLQSKISYLMGKLGPPPSE